jgi:hypothetical protein
MQKRKRHTWQLTDMDVGHNRREESDQFGQDSDWLKNEYILLHHLWMSIFGALRCYTRTRVWVYRCMTRAWVWFVGIWHWCGMSDSAKKKDTGVQVTYLPWAIVLHRELCSCFMVFVVARCLVFSYSACASCYFFLYQCLNSTSVAADRKQF